MWWEGIAGKLAVMLDVETVHKDRVAGEFSFSLELWGAAWCAPTTDALPVFHPKHFRAACSASFLCHFFLCMETVSHPKSH